jgi:hypothetical protein
MANSVTTNPIVLDSAGVVSTNPVTIKAIQVVFSGAGDSVVLSDANGDKVYQSVGTAEQLTDGLTVPGGIKALSLTATTISAGTFVLLYLK